MDTSITVTRQKRPSQRRPKYTVRSAPIKGYMEVAHSFPPPTC